MAGLMQEPVTFKDVAVYLSRAEWDAMAEGQRELYRSVMLDNYNLLTSLGYSGPKPDLLHRLDRGEEPWVCTPQSPGRWDGPDSPSPGHNGDGSWLQVSRWWPDADVHRVLEESTQLPHQGERPMHWRLRTRRLLNKIKCLCSESQAEESSRGAALVESRDQAQMDEKAEDKEEVTANGTQSRGFPLDPAMEKADSQEHQRGGRGRRFQRTAPKSPHALGEAASPQGHGELSDEALAEIVWQDHCYCASGGPWARAVPPSLREHNYCNQNAGDSALKDHKYCQVQRFRYQGWAKKSHRRARAGFFRLPRRKSPIGRIIRKAKRIMCHFSPCSHRRLELAQVKALPGLAPPARGREDPVEGTDGGAGLAKQGALRAQPLRKSGSQSGTPKPLGPTTVSHGTNTPPPSSPAGKGKREAVPHRVCIQHRVQRVRLIRRPGTQQGADGQGLADSSYVLLHKIYILVMRTGGHRQDSVCQGVEQGGCAQHQDAWPITTQTDS